MVKNFKITDLAPQKASFYLSILDKSFSIRPCTPKDLIDLKEKGIDVEKVIQNPISEDLCRIVLYLMEYESAKDFKKVTVKTIDIESGEEVIEEIGGYNLLLKCVSNVKEQMEMFFSLLLSMGFSNEQIEELRKETYDSINSIDASEKVKKKVKATKKKKAS